MKYLPEWKTRLKKTDEQFRTFNMTPSDLYNSNQNHFLRTLQTVYTKKKYLFKIWEL